MSEDFSKEFKEQATNRMLTLIMEISSATTFFTIGLVEHSEEEHQELFSQLSEDRVVEICREAKRLSGGSEGEVKLSELLRVALFRCYQDLDAAIKATEALLRKQGGSLQ